MKWLAILVLLLMSVSAMAANNLGRLFLSPAERTSLDHLREINPAPQGQVSGGSDAEDPEDVTAESSPVISVNGYVKRSDGKATVWVNGRPVDELGSEGIGLEKSNSTSQVMVKSPASGQKIKLKPGQYYDPVSGKVGDYSVSAAQEVSSSSRDARPENNQSVRNKQNQPQLDAENKDSIDQ